jgi:hypothetical protein
MKDELGKSISKLYTGIVKNIETSVINADKKIKEKRPVEAVKTFVSNNNPITKLGRKASDKKTEIVEGVKKSKNAYKTAAFGPPAGAGTPIVLSEKYKESIGPKQPERAPEVLSTPKKKPTIEEQAKTFMQKRSITPNSTPKKQDMNMKPPPWVGTITKKIDGVKEAIGEAPKREKEPVKEVKPEKETVTRESMLTTIATKLGGIRRNMTEQGRAENKERKTQRAEDKVNAKKERADRILMEKKNLREEIKENRKAAKKERFDKGNPLQRISKFQLEAKKARADGTFKTKKWRERTRKENKMFVFSKITSIVATLAKVLIAALVLGLVLKGIGKVLKVATKIKEFLFGKRLSEETTNAEQYGIGKGSTIDTTGIMASEDFDDKEKKIVAESSSLANSNKLGNFIAEGGRDTFGRTMNLTGAVLSKAGNIKYLNTLPQARAARAIGKKLSAGGAATLSATSFQGKTIGTTIDNQVDSTTFNRTREQIKKTGDKEKLKEFDDAYKQANKKNKADEKRLKRIAAGKSFSTKNLDAGEAEMYEGLTAEQAQEQLKMFKMKNGRFKGDGSRDLDRITKEITGKTYTEQKRSVLSDFEKANPNYLAGSSGDTSNIAAEFKEGSTWSKSQEKRNELLQEIKSAIAKANSGTTYISNDNSTNSSQSSTGGGETKYIGGPPVAVDKEAMVDHAIAG